MSLITPEAIQSQSANDLSIAKGQNQPAIVERADRFGDLSLPRESFRLDALSIKAPKGFEGKVTLVCDASGAIPASKKVQPSNTVQKWKSGEKPAPRPTDGEYQIAMTRGGEYYWAKKPKTFLEPGEAKKLASATNALPAKVAGAIPTSDKKNTAVVDVVSGRGVTWWLEGDPELKKPFPNAEKWTNNVHHVCWVINNDPGGATEGYIRSGGAACPPKRK